MVCKNCGIANSDTSRFCSECGSVLPVPKAEDHAGKAAAPVQEQAAAPQAPIFPVMPQMNMVPPLMPFAYVPPMSGIPVAPPSVMPVNTAPIVPPAAPAPTPVAAPEQPPEAAPVQQPVAPAQPIPAAPQAAPAAQPAAPATPAAPFGVPAANMGAYPAAPMMPQMMPSPYMQMPNPYAPYGFSPLMKDPRSAKVTWALWLGILSAVIPIVTCSYGSPLALVMGIIAICLAAVNLKKVYPQNHSKALAGVIVGSLGTALSLLGCIVVIRALGTVMNSNEFRQFSEQFNSFIAYNMLRVWKAAAFGVKAVVVQVQSILRILFMK